MVDEEMTRTGEGDADGPHTIFGECEHKSIGCENCVSKGYELELVGTREGTHSQLIRSSLELSWSVHNEIRCNDERWPSST
jgi:hypothetical protein